MVIDREFKRVRPALVDVVVEVAVFASTVGFVRGVDADELIFAVDNLLEELDETKEPCILRTVPACIELRLGELPRERRGDS